MSNSTQSTVYDDVPYTTHANVATHPDRLATIATLAGLAPVPVTRCRVLELGCGSGDNLIPMAASLPGASFVGCDLAGRPIAAGRRLAAALGLANLTLLHVDMRALPAALGDFDYIIAHGVYSWVPPQVREGMLALIARRLAPHGVAFVSYNTYPGCYVRRMAWEILKFHIDEITDPARRIAEVRALIAMLNDPANRQQPSNVALRHEFAELAKRPDGALFHDDLSEVNDPVWFHEFVAEAGAHGLQFVGEAEFAMTADADVAPGLRRVLARMDRLSREQYLDFARGRRFRQTLLCHANLALAAAVLPDRLADLSVIAPKLQSAMGLVFPAPERESVGPAPHAPPADADLADARAVLHDVAEAWPRPVSVRDLAASFRASTGDGIAGEVPPRLAEILLAAYGAAAIELHRFVPPIADAPGERPDAGPVAPLQLGSGSRVTNLWHENIDLDDPVARQLVTLLDGTRDRPALLAALGPEFGAASAEGPAALLERYLQHLARLALLVRERPSA